MLCVRKMLVAKKKNTKKQRTTKMSGKKFRVKFNCESRVEGGLSVQRGDIVLEEVIITIFKF